MANNLYNTCCNLRLCGADATLFLNGTENFALGQPVWEEAPLCLSTDALKQQMIDFDGWMSLSTRHVPNDGRLCVMRCGPNGTTYHGVATAQGHKFCFAGDIASLTPPHDILRRAVDLGQGLPPHLGIKILELAQKYMALIQAMATYDVVVATQFRECVLAALTGKPVRYLVYGADWRYILDNIDNKSDAESIIFEYILNKGTIIHGIFNWEDIMHISFRHGIAPYWLHCSEPMINIVNAIHPRNRSELRQKLGFTEEDFVVLLPSRIDTKIKKTDILLRAFSTFAEENPKALLMTAGWGKDLESMSHQFPLQNIRFLDHVMSKPLLFDAMCAADMVADQFADGAIGSTGREALALGRPLLSFISPCFQWTWKTPSPIVNVATEEDILHSLRYAKEHPQEMQNIGEQGRQWLLDNMDSSVFLEELEVLASNGPEKTLSYAPVLRTDILDYEMQCPRGRCTLQIARWPWPYTAGLTFSNDCEYYTWEHFCALHSFMGNKDMPTPLGMGLGLPFSDSFWFYDDSSSGFSWFHGTSFKPSAHAGFMEELVEMGFLDTIHAWGEFDATGAFSREHAQHAANCLHKLRRTPKIFSNHGSNNNRQNVGGRFAQPYHQGDVPGTNHYHTDILEELGVRWFWGDEGCTHQFSLHASGEPLPDDGICRPDAWPWSGQLLYRNRLQDGRHVHSFRRMRGALPKAPTASTLSCQLKPAYLDHLEKSHGGACIYQHLGCWRDQHGVPRPFTGQPFPPEALCMLKELAARYHAGRIWVPPLHAFLSYVHAIQNVVVDPIAMDGSLDIRIWFFSNDLAQESDLGGLSLLFRSELPLGRISFEDAHGQWHETRPEVRTLPDGRQLVQWPWQCLCDFPFNGKEIRTP